MSRCISTLNRVKERLECRLNSMDAGRMGCGTVMLVERPPADRLILKQACDEIEAVVKDLEKGETYGNPE